MRRSNKVRKVCSLGRKGEAQVPNLGRYGGLSKSGVFLMPLGRNRKFFPESTGKALLEMQIHLKRKKKNDTQSVFCSEVAV